MTDRNRPRKPSKKRELMNNKIRVEVKDNLKDSKP